MKWLPVVRYLTLLPLLTACPQWTGPLIDERKVVVVCALCIQLNWAEPERNTCRTPLYLPIVTTQRKLCSHRGSGWLQFHVVTQWKEWMLHKQWQTNSLLPYDSPALPQARVHTGHPRKCWNIFTAQHYSCCRIWAFDSRLCSSLCLRDASGIPLVTLQTTRLSCSLIAKPLSMCMQCNHTCHMPYFYISLKCQSASLN